MMRLRLLGTSVVIFAVLGPMLLAAFSLAADPWLLRAKVSSQGAFNATLEVLWALVLMPIVLWHFGIGTGLLGGVLCLLLVELGGARRSLVFSASLGALMGAVLTFPFPEFLVTVGGRTAASSVSLRIAAMLSGGVCGLLVASRGWKAAN